MINNQQKYDLFAGRVLSFFLIINIINIGVKQSFPSLPYLWLLTPFLGIVYILKLFLEYKNLKHLLRMVFLLEVFFGVMISCSILRYPYAMSSIGKRYIWVIAFCIPLFAIGYRIRDVDLVIEKTHTANMIIFFFAVFSFVSTYLRDGRFTYENYNMTLGYTLLFPALCHLSKSKTKKIYLILFLIEVLIISLYGSRGQLLSIAVFFLLSYLRNKTISKRLVLLSCMFVVVIILLICWPQISQHILYPIVEKTGSRTLSMLMRGKFLPGTDRTEIWMSTLHNIKDKPIMGWGVGGELSYLHSYPHNIFLEFCLHYGIPVGLLFSAMVSIVICKNMLNYRASEGGIILFASFFFPLLLSGTYTEAPIAWMLLGYCVGITVYIKEGIIIKKNSPNEIL